MIEHAPSDPPHFVSPPEPQVQAADFSNPRRTSIVFAEPAETRRSILLAASAPGTPVLGHTSSGTGSWGQVKQEAAIARGRGDRPRSLSSPPPPPSFIKRVGFDTFDNKDASEFSLTLKAKHKDYEYTRRSRTFLCGTDQNEYSEFALEWLLEELVDDGDEIVCLRVMDSHSTKTSHDSQERVYRHEARRLLEDIIDKNEEDKAISIVLEFAFGKVHETFQKMIHVYEPAILIVGTRGRPLGGIHGILPGSVSKYCLQHSPVPVIVVRPSNKREKKKRKRQADPARHAYMDILEKSHDTSIMHHGDNSSGKLVPSAAVSNASVISLAGSGGGGEDDELSRKGNVETVTECVNALGTLQIGALVRDAATAVEAGASTADTGTLSPEGLSPGTPAGGTPLPGTPLPGTPLPGTPLPQHGGEVNPMDVVGATLAQ